MKKSIIRKITAFVACMAITAPAFAQAASVSAAEFDTSVEEEIVQEYVDINSPVYLNLTHYYQSGNQPWSYDHCGGSSNNPTISSAGCAITSFSMLLSNYGIYADPGMVNSALGTSAYPSFSWSYAASYYGLPSPTITYYANTYVDKAYSHSAICNYIRNGKPVIIGMQNSSTGGTHFVVARGASPQNAYAYIYDPAYYTDYSVLSQYTNNGYYVYEIITF